MQHVFVKGKKSLLIKPVPQFIPIFSFEEENPVWNNLGNEVG